MSAMLFVTTGVPFIDIDGYACCVAYAELLRLTGKEAAAVSTARDWNKSITPALKGLPVQFSTEYKPAVDDSFIVVDLSDPTHFDPIVAIDRVAELFDHHPGFETYWTERLGDKCHIEAIGAAATQIFECWQAAGKLKQLSRESAELLAAAILDNTLNFNAGVTTDRDKAAFASLSKQVSLDSTWVASYFSECQAAIFADLPAAIRNDTKFLKFKGLPEEACAGQIVVWDARQTIARDLPKIADTLSSMRPYWFANIVSISEGRSYFLSDNTLAQSWLRGLLGVNFEGSLAIADKLWLRKEIMKLGQT